MFIDLTLLGAVRIIRVRVEAIAYLDGLANGGCNVGLIGGQTLRVNEDQAEVERRCGGDVAPPKPLGPKPKVTAPAPKRQVKKAR